MAEEESSFTKDELEVIEIFYKFTELAAIRWNPQLIPSWGRKGRRSAINVSPSPSPRSSNVDKTQFEIDVSNPPGIPLALSLSNTDSNLQVQPSRKKRLKKMKKTKTIKELKEMISKLFAQQELLNQEIAKVRDYYEKLRAQNLKLKAVKSQLASRRRLNPLSERVEELPSTSESEPEYEEEEEEEEEIRIIHQRSIEWIPDLNFPIKEADNGLDSHNHFDMNMVVITAQSKE